MRSLKSADWFTACDPSSVQLLFIIWFIANKQALLPKMRDGYGGAEKHSSWGTHLISIKHKSQPNSVVPTQSFSNSSQQEQSRIISEVGANLCERFAQSDSGLTQGAAFSSGGLLGSLADASPVLLSQSASGWNHKSSQRGAMKLFGFETFRFIFDLVYHSAWAIDGHLWWRCCPLIEWKL